MKNLNPNKSPIYATIADLHLTRSMPMMSHSLRADLIRNKDFQTLEAYADVASTVVVAFNSLSRNLTKFGVNLPKEMTVDTILHDKSAEAALEKARRKIKRAHLSPEDVGELICTAAQAVHDHRVTRYANPTAPESKLLDFLPAELQGWEAFSDSLIYIQPITDALDIDAMPGDIRNNYHRRVDNYLKRYGIETVYGLKQHLTNLDYHALPASTAAVIRTGKSAMDRMVYALVQRPHSYLQVINPFRSSAM